MEYLDFEQPIKELEEQLDKCIALGNESNVDVSDTCKKLTKRLEQVKKEIYENLTPWQRVQVSRHIDRPYALDYIKALCGDTFLELHGDRTVGDDKAMIGGLGKIGDQSYMFIGQQKGNNTKSRQYRNFGMPNPEGYRKALRLMKSAEKFNIPVVTFIDTPGAYPGIEAEERGQGEAIARNLLENTWYSVISPESCSSILWRTWEYKERAADALKLTAKDMKDNGLIDEIIKEPLGGAHRDREAVFESVKKAIEDTFKKLSKLSVEKLIEKRMDKYTSYGVYK